MLSIHLGDINAAVAKAWEQPFAGLHDVEVSCGDIFQHRADAIVSPANSFGFMDGGIDLLYSRVLGQHLEGELQALLRDRHFGELPVAIRTRCPPLSRRAATWPPTWLVAPMTTYNMQMAPTNRKVVMRGAQQAR